MRVGRYLLFGKLWGSGEGDREESDELDDRDDDDELVGTQSLLPRRTRFICFSNLRNLFAMYSKLSSRRRFGIITIFCAIWTSEVDEH